jgi:hypothetical protein
MKRYKSSKVALSLEYFSRTTSFDSMLDYLLVTQMHTFEKIAHRMRQLCIYIYIRFLHLDLKSNFFVATDKLDDSKSQKN